MINMNAARVLFFICLAVSVESQSGVNRQSSSAQVGQDLVDFVRRTLNDTVAKLFNQQWSTFATNLSPLLQPQGDKPVDILTETVSYPSELNNVTFTGYIAYPRGTRGWLYAIHIFMGELHSKLI